MRLTGIEIDRFGRWEQFSQSLHPSGLTVVYGPNEAGKTTLMRFIRGVLYGFPPEEKAEAWRKAQRLSQGGMLRVEHQGQSYDVHRTGMVNEPGQLSISGVEAGTRTTRILEEMVSETDGKLFESVFAVGLPELQQFATLNDEEVARHLYGLTLGPQGALLMDLPQRVDQELRTLWDGQQETGTIRQLLKRREELARHGSQQKSRRDRYRELLRRQTELDDKLTGFRRRQTELQHNLRGLSFTERVWSPWQKLRDFRRELGTLPDFSVFPADGIKQLARFDLEIQQAAHADEQQTAQLRELQRRIGLFGKGPEILRYARSIRRLKDERSEVREIETRLKSLAQQAADQERALQAQLTQLGKGWTFSRIDNLPFGSDATAKLTTAARDYQAVHWRTRRHQRWYRRLSLACRDRELALQTEFLQAGISAEDLNDPRKLLEQQLSRLMELARLQNEASVIRQRTGALDEQINRLHERMGLPDWAWALLAFFALAGAGLFVAGISQGVSTGWLVGLIYVVLSATAGGTAWALKYQSDQEQQAEVARLRDLRRDDFARLAEIQQQIRGLVDTIGLQLRRHSNNDALQVDAQLIAQAAQKLGRLEGLQQESQRLKRFRSRLSVMRGKLQTRQRELSLARANWCRAVTALGLDETVDVEGAFRQFQAAWNLLDGRRRWRLFDTEATACRQRLELFHRQIEELARRMRREGVSPANATATLEQWEIELDKAIAGRREVHELRQQLRERRQIHTQLKQQLQAYERERSALLKLAGASSRAEFDERLADMDRRKQVLELIQQTQREFDLLVRTEPDLKLVEEELIQYQPPSHKSRVQTAQQELQQIEQQLLQTSELLGTVKREVQELEGDRSDRRVQSDWAQCRYDLDQSVEQWFAAALGGEAVEAVCIQFEQTHQPETLAAAIPYLERLTCGKYKRLWTALGRRHLFVDDELGRARSTEQLSGGTREQLFLAIRLAMVRSLARHGVDLPMVLDDVTVNFDQERSAAAVDTLMDFVSEGQQVIVLTSHRYYAEMFQQRGVEPIWLPANAGYSYEERRAG